MDKKKGYSLERPKLNKRQEAYLGNQVMYVNGTYFSNITDKQGMSFSSSEKDPYDNVNHCGQFPSQGKDGFSAENNLQNRSKRRRCVMISIVVITVLIIAIVAAVLAVTLSKEEDKKEVETVKISAETFLKGEVTLSSKNWTDAYNNKTSIEYKTTKIEVIEMMDNQLGNSVFSNVYVQTTVDDIRKGSVIVECSWLMRMTKTFVKNESPDPPNFDFFVDLDIFTDAVEQIPNVTDVNVSDMTNCYPDSCKNGGTCKSGGNMFVCTCQPGFTGSTCEEEVTTAGPTRRTTTTEDRPTTYTGPTTTRKGDGTSKETAGPTTTSPGETYTTTEYIRTTETNESPCGTGVQYDYEITGAILWPFVEDLEMSSSSGYKEMEKTVIESLTGAMKSYGLSVCQLYLQKLYPVNPTSNSPDIPEKSIGFTVVASMMSVLYEMEIQLTFDVYLPEHFYFISMKAMQTTTNYPTTPPTTYPSKPCSSSSSNMIYSFNITYMETFTNDLFDSTSDGFMKLNKTLSEAFTVQAKNEGGEQWICDIGLIRCVPTPSAFSSGEPHISAEVQVHVPVNTLDINTAAYYFSLAVQQTGKMLLIRYEIIFSPTTTMVMETTVRTTTTAIGPKTTDCLFMCDFGTNCISIEQYCNGYTDCFDYSDELSCPTTTVKTPSTTIQ